jgi:sugar phosphate isomerase/epimerase
MLSDRREFIKTSVMLGLGISLFPTRIYANSRHFHPKIGVCTGIANSSIIKAAGYSYIEEGVRGFLVPSEPDEVFNINLAQLKNSGIPMEACNSFLPGELKCVGPDAVHEKILQYAKTAFRRAEQSGVKTIVFGSSGARKIPEGFTKADARKQFVSLCKQMAPVAKKHSVVISLEPLNSKECNFINSVSEGGEIVREVDHPNFRLLADIYHMLIEEEGPESLVENGKYLYHVHIAEKEGRTAPGFHGEDFTPYFKALKQVGYKGRISVECSWENLQAQAEKTLQTINAQIDSVNNNK